METVFMNRCVITVAMALGALAAAGCDGGGTASGPSPG